MDLEWEFQNLQDTTGWRPEDGKEELIIALQSYTDDEELQNALLDFCEELKKTSSTKTAEEVQTDSTGVSQDIAWTETPEEDQEPIMDFSSDTPFLDYVQEVFEDLESVHEGEVVNHTPHQAKTSSIGYEEDLADYGDSYAAQKYVQWANESGRGLSPSWDDLEDFQMAAGDLSEDQHNALLNGVAKQYQREMNSNRENRMNRRSSGAKYASPQDRLQDWVEKSLAGEADQGEYQQLVDAFGVDEAMMSEMLADEYAMQGYVYDNDNEEFITLDEYDRLSEQFGADNLSVKEPTGGTEYFRHSNRKRNRVNRKSNRNVTSSYAARHGKYRIVASKNAEGKYEGRVFAGDKLIGRTKSARLDKVLSRESIRAARKTASQKSVTAQKLARDGWDQFDIGMGGAMGVGYERKNSDGTVTVVAPTDIDGEGYGLEVLDGDAAHGQHWSVENYRNQSDFHEGGGEPEPLGTFKTLDEAMGRISRMERRASKGRRQSRKITATDLPTPQGWEWIDGGTANSLYGVDDYSPDELLLEMAEGGDRSIDPTDFFSEESGLRVRPDGSWVDEGGRHGLGLGEGSDMDSLLEHMKGLGYGENARPGEGPW